MITGDGFKAGEVFTLTIDVGGAHQEQQVTADAQGHFARATGIPMRPGASVRIDARGDQSTGKAVITTVPNLLANRSAGGPPVILAAILGVALVGGGLLLRWRGLV
jgi:hypothetical protein